MARDYSGPENFHFFGQYCSGLFKAAPEVSTSGGYCLVGYWKAFHSIFAIACVVLWERYMHIGLAGIQDHSIHD